MMNSTHNLNDDSYTKFIKWILHKILTMNSTQNFQERANLDEEEKMRLQEEMEAKLKAIEEMEERERVKNEELTKWQSEVSVN